MDYVSGACRNKEQQSNEESSIDLHDWDDSVWARSRLWDDLLADNKTDWSSLIFSYSVITSKPTIFIFSDAGVLSKSRRTKHILGIMSCNSITVNVLIIACVLLVY